MKRTNVLLKYYSETGYEVIRTPRDGDAGYDLVTPIDFTVGAYMPNSDDSLSYSLMFEANGTVTYVSPHPEDFHHVALVNLGLHVEIPHGYVGVICNRSSVGVGKFNAPLDQLIAAPSSLSYAEIQKIESAALNRFSVTRKMGAISVFQGIIDSSYRGAIILAMTNFNNRPVTFKAGDKVAQMLILPHYSSGIESVASLELLTSTERGAQGFGSTGQ